MMRTRPAQAFGGSRALAAGRRMGAVGLALLAGALVVAPLLCGAHAALHGQMGPSHALCAGATLLAVGTAFALLAVAATYRLAAEGPALYAPLIPDPVFKPPQ